MDASDICRKPGSRVGDYLWVWGNPEYSLEQTTGGSGTPRR